MTFTMTIESHNEDNGADMVADTLSDIAGRVEDGFTSGPIMDRNGNTVGNWDLNV